MKKIRTILASLFVVVSLAAIAVPALAADQPSTEGNTTSTTVGQVASRCDIPPKLVIDEK